MTLDIELHRVAWIGHDVGPRLQSIRHISKNISRRIQALRQSIRSNFGFQFQELEQVNDLMITPITNRDPGIILIRGFPINSLRSNPVRIISVNRRGIEKLGNEAIDKLRITPGKGFPVLKDVAPVPLKMMHRFSRLILHADIKSVPRSAGVAMSTTQHERQIFFCQTNQIGITQ